MCGGAAVEATLVLRSESCAVELHVSACAWPTVFAPVGLVKEVADLDAISFTFAFPRVVLALALGLCGLRCSICCLSLLLLLCLLCLQQLRLRFILLGGLSVGEFARFGAEVSPQGLYLSLGLYVTSADASIHQKRVVSVS